MHASNVHNEKWKEYLLQQKFESLIQTFVSNYPVRNVCKSVERTHQKHCFGVTLSKIIKRLYFKLLQIVSFNTMMLIGMKSSDNWTFFDHTVGL